MFSYLYISTSSHLPEIFLLLEGFVNAVICHTEHAEFSLFFSSAFSKHYETCHVWNNNSLAVELSSKSASISNILAVHQHESTNKAKNIYT